MKAPVNCTMLVVEDELQAQEVLRDILSKKYPALRLHFASDGEAGLALFKEVEPEVVLTDLNMPKMNGLRMAQEIRSLAPQVPIIVLTAYNDTSQILESIRIGISRYVLKPIECQQLFEAIDGCLRGIEDIRGRRRAEQELRDHLDNLEVLIRERTGELESRNRQLAVEVQERKRAEQEVAALNARLEERVLERTAELEAAMRAQESFSYAISHDLRAPLRHINSYSCMLAEALGNENEEVRHALERMTSATTRMGTLIDHLLELSRISRSQICRQEVDFSDLARRVADMLRETDQARCVEFAIEEGLHVNGDGILLRQLLENLFHNAWKYTSPRPRGRIELGRSTIDGAECFFVRDNGVGFDMTYSSKLFEIFERLHGSEFEGTGVGLATVQRILQRHGGDIWAESEPDRGATFYFTLK
jgi:signal transduction histidine kinase